MKLTATTRHKLYDHCKNTLEQQWTDERKSIVSKLEEKPDGKRFPVCPPYGQPQTWLIGLVLNSCCCLCMLPSLICRCPFISSRDIGLVWFFFLAFVLVPDFCTECLVDCIILLLFLPLNFFTPGPKQRRVVELQQTQAHVKYITNVKQIRFITRMCGKAQHDCRPLGGSELRSSF